MSARLTRRTFVGGACLAAATPSANAQEVTLRAASGFAEKTYSSRPLERFIEKVNRDGKGLVRIQYVGGPGAVPPFELGNAVKNRVVDIGGLPFSFYASLLPEGDAVKLSEVSTADMRTNGAMEFIDKLHNQRMNAHLLARAISNVPLHLYFVKPVKGTDLTGLRIRVTPLYRDLVEALGGTPVTTAPGEVYTALERGVVDGYGWPLQGIFDLGWHEVTKYRLDPGFYNAATNILINQDSLRRLTEAQRKVLVDAAAWLEGLDAQNEAENQQERERQAGAGIRPIALTATEQEAFLKKAREVGWGAVTKKHPETAASLKPLLTRP